MKLYYIGKDTTAIGYCAGRQIIFDADRNFCREVSEAAATVLLATGDYMPANTEAAKCAVRRAHRIKGKQLTEKKLAELSGVENGVTISAREMLLADVANQELKTCKGCQKEMDPAEPVAIMSGSLDERTIYCAECESVIMQLGLVEEVPADEPTEDVKPAETVKQKKPKKKTAKKAVKK